MFQIPRGTRDFTPEEMEKRRYVEDCMRSTFQTFGYREIQTPMFETLELFTAKSGDAIIEEIYSFTDKGGRELALRPELTAPVIRFYVERLQMEAKPLKLFYFGNCFRYGRPQKGRYREFRQAGCELIGASTPEALAELIALAYYAIKNTGLKNIDLRIGNLDYLNQQFDVNLSDYYPDGSADIYRLVDKEDFEELKIQFNEAGVPEEIQNEFMGFLKSGSTNELKKYIGDSERKRYEEIISILKKEFGISRVKPEMKIARGLDYYKGIIFEIDAPALGAEKQLCGGGEYDLVKLFGGTDVPTAGFAIGFDRTVLALETEKYRFPLPKLDVYVIPVNKDMIDKSLEIAQKLRRQGISTDLDLLGRGMSKSLKYASSLNAEKAIIVGPKELEQDSITIRDMDSGKQEIVRIRDVYQIVKTGKNLS